jgi:flagellar biosynthesis protein FlhF
VRLKSYYTATVESAIRLAHIELGDQAVFLGARRNDVGSDPNQAYEVSFAVMEGEDSREPASAGSNGRGLGTPRGAGAGPAAGGSGPAPRPAAAAADSGALVSWKKFLRQVGTRDDPAAAAGANGIREPVAEDHAPISPGRENGAPSKKAGPLSSAGRGSALPHWKEFLPGDPAGRETTPAPVLLTDAARVLEAGAAQAAPAAPARAAPAAGGATAAGAAAAQPAASPARNGAAPHASQTAKKSPRAAQPAFVDGPATQVYSLAKLGAELEELRRMFERQQNGRAPLVLPSRELLSDPVLARLYRGLSDNGVEPALAAELVAGLQKAAEQGIEAARLAALLGREICARFKTNSDLGQSGAPRSVAALVGPSGAGKTTAVAKLALRCGLLRRRRVRLFAVDQLRIGAVEPLEAYAELMNTPLQVIDEFDKLGAALDAAGEDAGRELVLIDTPGYGRREWERARRMAAALAALGDVDVHLVLDLRTKTEDLRRTVENFRVFRPAKLLFTRLDETTTFGTMLNETVRTGLPVSFVSVGQRVPEDIVPAGEPELLRLLLRDRASH